MQGSHDLSERDNMPFKSWTPFCDHPGEITVSKSVVVDGENSSDHTVKLCPECGLFTVNVGTVNQRVVFSFWLNTEMEYEAAGAWLRNAEEQFKRDQKSRK